MDVTFALNHNFCIENERTWSYGMYCISWHSHGLLHSWNITQATKFALLEPKAIHVVSEPDYLISLLCHLNFSFGLYRAQGSIRVWIILTQLTIRNCPLICSFAMFKRLQTKDCAWSGSSKNKLQRRCFYLWFFPAFLTTFFHLLRCNSTYTNGCHYGSAVIDLLLSSFSKYSIIRHFLRQLWTLC